MTVDKMEIRKVTVEQSMHEEDVLLKILMGQNVGSLSMMLRQTSVLRIAHQHTNPKEKVLGHKISAEHLAEHFDSLCLILCP
jgi:hypothetical protein